MCGRRPFLLWFKRNLYDKIQAYSERAHMDK